VEVKSGNSFSLQSHSVLLDIVSSVLLKLYVLSNSLDASLCAAIVVQPMVEYGWLLGKAIAGDAAIWGGILNAFQGT
jgi:hypothetical protein